MEISGKVLSILPLQSGEGRNGQWKKQDFIVETDGTYPKKVCVSVWGDKIDQFALNEGETITASINLESREFNGKWYTDVKAWKVEKATTQMGEGAQDALPPFMEGGLPTEEPPAFAEGEDDLPF